MNEPTPHEKPSAGLSWMIWPGIVVGLLVGQLTASFIAAALALGDPAQVVEPDYYGKALRWEQTQAELRNSEQLGWAAVWEIAPAADLVGQREATLRLNDAAGQSITDATVEVFFYHHAVSGDRKAHLLPHVDGGAYAAVLPMRRDGTWQMNLRVTRDATVFVNEQAISVGDRWKDAP